MRVQGDADALRRMLRNVGENAVRHASSRVDVTLVERGEEVVLTIDDDGPGIPATERARRCRIYAKPRTPKTWSTASRVR